MSSSAFSLSTRLTGGTHRFLLWVDVDEDRAKAMNGQHYYRWIQAFEWPLSTYPVITLPGNFGILPTKIGLYLQSTSVTLIFQDA